MIDDLHESAYFSAGHDAFPGERAEAPWWVLSVLWGTVLLNVWFGLQPALPLELAREAAGALLVRP